MIDIVEREKIEMRKLELLALSTFLKDVVKISSTHIQFIYTLAIPSVILFRDFEDTTQDNVEVTFREAASQIKSSLESVYFFVSSTDEPKLRLILNQLKINKKVLPQVGFIMPVERRGDSEVFNTYRITPVEKLTAETLSQFISQTLMEKRAISGDFMQTQQLKSRQRTPPNFNS